MKLFSGSSNKPLAEKIAHALNISVSPVEIFIFPDQERRIRLEESVVDEDVILVQSTSTPVDTNYMELFFLADAVKRSGAQSMTAVIPYMGYQRQDHVFRDGEAVSLQVVIHTLEALGVKKVIAFDLHSIKIPEFFHIPINHLSALQLFADIIKKNGFDKEYTSLVTPDMGGIRRIKILSEILDDMSFVTVEKNRDLASGKVEVISFEGEIKKYAVIVDDMISSGKTTIQTAKLLREKGAEKVIVCVTHPIFSEDASKLLQKSTIEKVYVTDSVFVSEEKRFAKLETLSVADLIAKVFKNP